MIKIHWFYLPPVIKNKFAQKILSFILMRLVIYVETKIPLSKQRFSYNIYGKPSLQNNINFHFNLSHSGNYLVCAVSDCPIGIDIEVTKPINLNIAKRFFNKQEQAFIVQSPHNRLHRFYEIWTKKESYIKLQGLNITSLKSFDVFDLPTVQFYSISNNKNLIGHLCFEKK